MYKRKSFLAKVFSLFLSILLFTTILAPLVVFAEEGAPLLPDGAADNWQQHDITIIGEAGTNEITEDGWRHFKAGPSNGNGTPLPAVFVNEDFAMPEEGFFETTLRPALEPGNTRFGVYLHYTNPGTTFFVGYDTDGWFWEKYTGESSEWFSGARVPAPAANSEVTLRLEWSGQKLTLATVDGTELFPAGLPVDYTGQCGEGNRLAIKCSTWGASQSEVFLKNIHYSGQQPIASYSVSGVVQKEDATPLAGAVVQVDGNSTVTTGEDGAFSLGGLTNGQHTLTVSKDRYTSATHPFTIADDNIILEAISLALDEGALVPADGIFDNWVQETFTVKGKETNEIIDGWLHLSAGEGNGNSQTNQSQYPAIFINNDITMAEKGFFETKLRSPIEGTKNRFGVYLNYTNPGETFFVGYDAGGWFWEKYTGGSSQWYSGARVAAPAANDEVTLRLEWDGKALTAATVDGIALFPADSLPLDYSAITGTGLGIKCAGYKTDFTNVFLQDIHYTGQVMKEAYKVSGTVQNTQGQAIEGAAVTLGGKSTSTAADGSFSLYAPDGTYTLGVAQQEYKPAEKTVTVSGANNNIGTIILEELIENSLPIQSDVMKVDVDPDFPRVLRYTMQDSGKIFQGQREKLDTIEINGIAIQPVVTSTPGEDRIEYQLSVEDLAKNINALLTAELVVENNTLAFNITKVENKLDNDAYPVQTIYIPNHNLVSVNSTQQNPNFAGAVMSNTTTVSGDRFYTLDKMNPGTSRYLYAFISNDQLSAGLWSNSEFGTAGGGSDNNRVTANVTSQGAIKTVGLGSSFWYYNRVITNEFKTPVLRYVMEPSAMPSTKVAIADDLNTDDTINWQDGAIAYRDIMNNPFKNEEVPELVSARIAMNFGSQAQNPFLMTLDNVKKVSLHTDGLGQSILLKGYGNEGHDSAHPDYGDIGTRIGGLEDMKILMDEGADYGARFGIHINAGEMYPEAKAFSDELVRRDKNGNIRYGWNWIDQGIGLDSRFDHGSGLRLDRFAQLKNKVGDSLDWIYLDIWGNNTGSAEDAWDSRQIAKEITDNGWRFGNEWAWAHEYDTTFQHWSTDLGYGGYQAKGSNSTIMRFLRNHQRDTWVAERTQYSGASLAPLLGGYNMKDFEGWQGRNDYDEYILNLYSFNLTTKFLQHYKVVEWENGETVSIPGPSAVGGTTMWAPEMMVKLQNENGDTVVVTRQSNDYAASPSLYRSRVITLNGVEILRGEMAIDSGTVTPKTESYLLPWFWDAKTGQALPTADEKLYHFNAAGGTTTWQLPESWQGLGTVKMYKLTDTGRMEAGTIAVENGSVTLNADATTPYVLYRGEAATLANVVWSTGMHINDSGFNSGTLSHWANAGTGSAEIVRSQFSNPMLRLGGEISLTQTLTGLTPGQNYAVYVGVDNRSSANAWLEVSSGENLAANYTGLSIARNYVQANAHNTNSATVNGSSYFQNMYAFFTAPAGEVTLTLRKEAGAGYTYFDDIRVVNTQAVNQITFDKNGNVTQFAQDFEHNAQGLYPFVVGGLEGVTDNRIHLSELHAPYTQAGWDIKKMDDVLNGNWSVKINGLTQRNNVAFQTIPQTIRFAPDTTYEIEFNYQMGSPGTYQFVVGDGEAGKGTMEFFDLEMSLGSTKIFKHTVVGSASGQTWVGIYSTGKAPDAQGTTSSVTSFGGYLDFVLDDFSFNVSDINKGELAAILRVANPLLEQDYTPETWALFGEKRTTANELFANPNAAQNDIDGAVDALQQAMESLVKIVGSVTGVVTDLNGAPLEGVTVTLNTPTLQPQQAVTNGQGRYIFTGVLLRNYKARIAVPGYETVYGTPLTLTSGENTKDFALVVKQAADYTNNFDEQNIDSIQKLAGSNGSITAEATAYNDSNALLLSFASGRAAFVDENAPTMKNGVFEADVTPLDSPQRLGLIMRANNINTLMLGSVQDSPNKYFWEYFGGVDGNKYSATFTGPLLQVNETYHFKMEIKDDKTVTMAVDGVEIFKATVPNLPADAGFVGFHGRTGGRFVVDNIEVTSYDPPAPGTATLSGKVMARDNGLWNATVQLRTNDNTLATAVTDLTGQFTFKGIQPGSYTLSAQRAGYRTEVQTITVEDANIANLSLSLVHIQTLTDLLNAVSHKQPETYTPASWAPFATARDAATALISSTSATQVEVDNATETLRTANANLKLAGADTSTLDAFIATVEGLTESDYRSSAWAAMQPILAQAKQVAVKEGVTSEEVSSAVAALQQAYNTLLSHFVDRTHLTTNITLGEKMVAETGKYTPASIDALTKSLAAAKAINGDADATATAINNAAKELGKVLLAMETLPDVSKLKELLALANALQQQSYTPNSWEPLETAIANGQALLKATSSTEAEISLASKNLASAMENLVLRANFASLETAIANAQALLEKQDMYTPVSMAAVTEALPKAQAVLANANATQQQVNEATANLQNVLANVTAKANLNSLWAAIGKAQNLNSGLYTAESFARVQTALNNALIVTRNPNATQAQVNASLLELDSQMAALVAVQATPAPSQPSGGTGSTTPAASSKPTASRSTSTSAPSSAPSAPASSESTSSKVASSEEQSSSETQSIAKEDLPENQTPTTNPQIKSNNLWMFVLAAVAVVCLLGTGITVFIKKKNKQ